MTDKVTIAVGSRRFRVHWLEYDVGGDPIDALRGHVQVTADQAAITWLSEHQPSSIRVGDTELGFVDWDTAQSEGATWWIHIRGAQGEGAARSARRRRPGPNRLNPGPAQARQSQGAGGPRT
jgi:hypothetical protein